MSASGGLDLLLLFPNNRVRAYGALAAKYAGINPPVQLGLTAAFVRQAGYSVKALDADAENLDAEQAAARALAERPRLILISTDSLNSGDVTKMAAASDTIRALRRSPGAPPIALEGVVPSAFPERMLREEGADYAIQGEAFQQVVDLLAALRREERLESEIPGIWHLDGDRLVSSARPVMIKEPDTIPMTAWDLLPVQKYRAHHWHCFGDLERRQPYASIFTNLGCPYTCTFCNVNVVAGKANFRPRTPENVIEEIDLLVTRYGVRNLRIVDNVFTIRLDLVEKLCDLIIARGYDLNMWCYARVETIKEPALLFKMKKAGVNWVAFGIEAANARVRQAVEKASSEASIDRAIERTQQAGISIVGNFIFGLPEDDLSTMRETLDMAKKYNFEYANFYAAMAYPGTELHRMAVEQKMELPSTWSGYGHYSPDALPMSTRYLTPAQVLKFRDEAFVEYNTNPAYQEMIRRRFGQATLDCILELLAIKLPRKLYGVASPA